ncbi:hypothetical protein ACSS6N_12045 [Peribacillus frigoritolerans]|uniref:hypothetical protein n=1 Tax=Peribacillus frigoritolerans TaxID=450367 RepID=UPI003F874C01
MNAFKAIIVEEMQSILSELWHEIQSMKNEPKLMGIKGDIDWLETCTHMLFDDLDYYMEGKEVLHVSINSTITRMEGIINKEGNNKLVSMNYYTRYLLTQFKRL